MNVDTGQARAGWYAAVNGLQPGIANRMNWASRIKTDDPEKIEQGKFEGDFEDHLHGKDKYVDLINGVDHIVFLEYGHSRQAPAGMVRIAMRKNREQLPALMNDEFLAEWNSFNF